MIATEWDKPGDEDDQNTREIAEAMGLTLEQFNLLPDWFKEDPAQFIVEHPEIQEVLTRINFESIDIPSLAQNFQSIEGFNNVLAWVQQIDRTQWVMLIHHFTSVGDQFHAQLLEAVGKLVGFISVPKEARPPIGSLRRRRISRWRDLF